MSVLVLCAWCNATISEDPGLDGAREPSHGICYGCVKDLDLFPTENIRALSAAELDRLPLGVIELDGDCVVRRYNETEARAAGLAAADVLGRHFFDEVAPCTSVAEFRGRAEEMIRSEHSCRDELDFVFRFRTGDRFAHLVFAWDARDRRLTILIQLLGNPADHADRCRDAWR